MKPGTIREVARATGLSTATISRVVNGNANVAAATREKVLAACETLNYLPNAAARALSMRRSRTVAAIIPTIEHSVFAKYIAAIEGALGARGYTLVLAISNADRDEELKAARKLLGMGAEAFILTGADHRAALVELFERREVPFVFTSIWDEAVSQPVIGYDNHALAGDAVRYLVDNGHQRIGVIHGPLAENDRTAARRRGAMAGVADDIRLDFIETSLDVAGGKAATGSVLELCQRPTALLCFSDVLALGAYFGLAEAGLSVPDDMSVMGFDNLDWSADATPPLTTIDLPAGEMGSQVAAQLIATLESGAPVTPTRLTSQLVIRGSVKAL